MLKIPYEEIKQKISEKSDMSIDEIEEKIDTKMKQLSGLISKEGAAHIIANELGIKLFEQTSGKLQIKNIVSGMRNVETVGKVTAVYDVREFQTEKRKGKVGSFYLGDSSGSIRVTCWNDKADDISKINQGDTVKVSGCYARDNQGRVEIHMNDKSSMEINPEGESVGEVVAQSQRPKAQRKNIVDLSENDQNVEILGTIVQAFEPRFFEVCPECGKRAKPQGDSFSCYTHGNVTPDYSYVMNAVIDDGTETIRGVFFRNQMERLLQKEQSEILKFREEPMAFNDTKQELLGTMVKIIGRANKNEMFDRLEFMSNIVEVNPSAEQELNRLKAEKSDIKEEA